LISLKFPAISQSRLQLSVSAGPTFTSKIKYYNCTGYINTAMTGSLALIYRIDSTFGIELKFSASHPTSYLDNDANNTLKVYTTSNITFQRILAGFNYYIPQKGFQPFVGLVAGASYAQTTETAPESSIINFNWGFQTGATFNIAKPIALRLDACAVFIPNVPNNSSFFNVAADGSGFPGFIIGNPSKANITQWNINLGLLFNLGT
jgi:hypothetical protein